MKTKKEIIDRCEQIKSDIRTAESNLHLGWATSESSQENQQRNIDLLRAKLNALLWAASDD